MNAHTLTYECPYCRTRVDIDDDVVDTTVMCPNPACQRAFRPVAPAAPVIDTANAADTPARPQRQPVKNERVLRVVHPVMVRKHPFLYLLCVALVVVGTSGAALSYIAPPAGTDPDVVFAWGLAAALVGIGLLLVWAIRVLATTLTITNRRSILRHGIIARQTTEVRHDDVRNLQVEQGIVQRILGIGNLAVSSAGQDELEIQATGISKPHHLAEIIRQYQNTSSATTE